MKTNALLAVFVTSMLCLLLYACTSAGSFMRVYGYMELIPPSTLLSPGAMVTVISRSPFQVRLVCGPRASLGPNWQPRSSYTASHTVRSQSGKSFQIAGEMMDLIKADARFSSVASISATIDRPTIAELDDNDVVSNLRYRSKACETAIALRVANKFPVTMVSSGLIADVRYSVTWDQNSHLSMKQKKDTLKELAVEIGIGTSAVNTEEIYAKGLVWGIRDDEYLAAISLSDIDANCVKRGSRLLDANSYAKFDRDADAPLVLPPPDASGHVGLRPPVLVGGEDVTSYPTVEVRGHDHP